MNYFIGIGKVINEINFDFFLNSKKNISAANTFIEITNHYKLNAPTIIKIIGFNDVADKMYRKLYIGNYILIYGTLTTKGYIELTYFQKI